MTIENVWEYDINIEDEYQFDIYSRAAVVEYYL
jgi:hypothetical protein